MENKVYLVGAGPGDDRLLTLRGKSLLTRCDVLIYDRLASDTLLHWTKPECETIYVGKAPGRHSMTQEEINQVLVEKGTTGKMVVRLKGGDPFVFGRGGEEVLALEKAGIAYEVVPGVTSAIAVPECAGIPVTHRGMSRSVHIITGHTKDCDDSLTDDYEQLAKLEGTLVFLMGMGNLERITRRLIAFGKPGATKAAVITEGTTKRQRCVRGTLENIVELVEKQQMKPPGILVVGAVAAWEMVQKGKDSGKERITGVIATAHFYKRLSKEWQETAGTLLHLCEQKIIPVTNGYMAQLYTKLHTYTWVVFTSGNGVHLFMEQLRKQAVDIRSLAGCKFAVIGSGTAETLKEYGILADYMPEQFTAKALAEGLLAETSEADRILLARAKQGAKCLYEILTAGKRQVEDAAIYDVAMQEMPDQRELAAVDRLVFASASGVRNFFEKLGTDAEAMNLLRKKQYICIGDATRRELDKYHMEQVETAKEFTAKGICSLCHARDI